MRARARAIGAALFLVTAACSSGGDEASDVSSDAGAADAMVSTPTSAPASDAGPEAGTATPTSGTPGGASPSPAPTTTALAGSAAAQRAPSPTTTAPPAPTTAPTTTTAPPAGPTAAITIQNFAFSPPVLNVAAGTTVTATNRDSAPHSWTADDGTWDSGTLSQDASYSYRFGRSGTFSYYCAIHPSMKGTVNVA